MTAAILRAEGLVKHFHIAQGFLSSPLTVRAVDNVSLSVARGSTLAIVGESGCGKSTLARLLLRLIEPTAGKVHFEDQDVLALGHRGLRALRRRMQMVFQDPYASLDPRMTVGSILAEPLRLHRLAGARDRKRKVAELLELVGLAASYANRYPHEFSGGQRQRIGIARALAVNPALIVGDEPVSALDVSVQAQIINLLQDLQERFGLTLIIIAHDLTVVRHVSDRVAVMYLGQIVEMADTAALFDEPRHPYAQALLAAIPIPDPARRSQRRVLVQGDVPNPAAPPSGCRFHTRCPHVRDRCRSEMPALSDEGGHAVACHFWKELPRPTELLAAHRSVAAPPYQVRLDAIAKRRAALMSNTPT